MAWTEEDRKAFLAEMHACFTNEQISRFPEEVQRGDRRPVGKEADLWIEMQRKWNYKRSEEQVRLIAGLGPSYQKYFDEDVRTGKRQWDKKEKEAFRQFSYERSLIRPR